MNGENVKNGEEKADNDTEKPAAALQGEALLAFYAMPENDDADDHQDGCPCCLPR